MPGEPPETPDGPSQGPERPSRPEEGRLPGGRIQQAGSQEAPLTVGQAPVLVAAPDPRMGLNVEFESLARGPNRTGSDIRQLPYYAFRNP